MRSFRSGHEQLTSFQSLGRIDPDLVPTDRLISQFDIFSIGSRQAGLYIAGLQPMPYNDRFSFLYFIHSGFELHVLPSLFPGRPYHFSQKLRLIVK